MKKWKRIVGGALAGVLAVSTAVSAFAAAAEEEQVDTTLPEGITQELLDEAVVNMDANAINLLGMAGLDWDSLVSNKTVGELIGTLHDLFAPLGESSGMRLGPQMIELYAAFENLPANPLDDYWWYDIEDVPFTVSKPLVARLSSPRDNRPDKPIQKCSKSPEPCGFPGFFLSKKSVVLCPILEGFDLA
ncbi:MAG: hypothetical protein ACLU8W_13295 [Clostridia bacterium]